MITLTVSILLAIIGIALLVVGEVKVSYRKEESVSLKKWSMIPFGLAFLTMLFGSFYTQDPGEAIVIKSFSGKVVDVDTTPGLSLTAPWNSTISFDIRNQRIEMFGGNGSPEGKDGVVIQAPLEGSSNAFVSITVRYSIKPDCVGEVYNINKSQENLSLNVLNPGVRDTVRVATSQFPPLEVKERRAELAADIEKGLTEAWKDDCIIVDNVDLGSLSLDQATEKAISQRNTRQLKVESARADLERSAIEAERTKVRAQADADADQIIRCGAITTESTKIIAGKEITTTVIVPKEGVACEERLNPQVLQSKYLEALRSIGKNGNMVIVVPEGGDTSLILPTPPTK